MANCREIEGQLTAYVDGEAGAASRVHVETHLEHCGACRARVTAERAAHELLVSRQQGLRGCAPDALRSRCAAQRAVAVSGAGAFARRAFAPFAIAASVVFAAVMFLMFGWGSSVETYAAQLAVDHIKCVQFPPSTAMEPEAIGRRWESTNGWPLKFTQATHPERLEFVGLRRCGSTHGRVAHILYRWRGEPVSVYVLNDTVDGSPEVGDDGTHASVTKLGERALIWTRRGRTYAVVGRARTPDLEQVAAHVQRTIE